MNIAATQYTLKHKTFEIYLSGCDGYCSKQCHNKELWDFNLGKPYQREIDKIINKVNEFDNLIDNIWILGGEPLLQNHNEVLNLIYDIKTTNKKIWLWTRFDIEKIPQQIKEQCDYIKVGKYIEELKCEDNIQYGIKLATSNQKIIKLK